MCVWGGGEEGSGWVSNACGAAVIFFAAEGIYLVLIGLGLRIIPVFLILELLLIVLIQVHLLEAG